MIFIHHYVSPSGVSHCVRSGLDLGAPQGMQNSMIHVFCARSPACALRINWQLVRVEGNLCEYRHGL